MAERTAQNYSNHTRFDPLFHFFLLPVAGITLGFAVYNAIQNFGFAGIWFVVLAVAFVVGVVKMRLYALKAQDRVIRLEERMRLALLCPEPLRSRIPELTEGQLIALRFACDSECPGLVEKALSSKLSSKQIKKDIQQWRPDYFRI